METHIFEISKDIRAMYVQADPFPQGIPAAFDRLETALSGSTSDNPGSWRGHLSEWNVYGVSDMEDGQMTYRACAGEKFAGEAEKHGLPVTVIPAGAYVAASVADWQADKSRIRSAFEELGQQVEVKSGSVYLEYYKSPGEVIIMLLPNEPAG